MPFGEIALLAEELGYSHLWVNDHITSPLGQESHISPYMFDPFMTIATAGALTSDIGLGIQVVAPYYEPLWLANALASLDTLSNGRVLASLGVGWSKPEFDALSSDFSNRGARAEEIIHIIRTAWSQDYVPIATAHYQLPPVKIAPKPAHPIPLWIAGTSERAYRRAVELGDGYHGHAVQDITVENVVDRVGSDPASASRGVLHLLRVHLGMGSRPVEARTRFWRNRRPTKRPASNTSSSRWIRQTSTPGCATSDAWPS